MTVGHLFNYGGVVTLKFFRRYHFHIEMLVLSKAKDNLCANAFHKLFRANRLSEHITPNGELLGGVLFVVKTGWQWATMQFRPGEEPLALQLKACSSLGLYRRQSGSRECSLGKAGSYIKVGTNQPIEALLCHFS